MSEVLVPLLILLAVLVGAIYSGLFSRSGMAQLVSRLKLEGSICLSALAKLAGGVKRKNMAGQLRPTGSLGDSAAGMSRGAEPNTVQDLYAPLDMSMLNCRIRTVELKEGSTVVDAFAVEICGTIHAPEDIRIATLRISILDITDGSAEAKKVRTRDPQGASSGESGNSEF